MPQSGRGGKRSGKPGASYPNRSDMAQAPRAVPNQPYGQAGQQLQAQQTVPLPGPSGAPSPMPAPGPTPGQLGPLNALTTRPSEPLTAGLSQGPGPGPQSLTPPDPLVKFAAVLNSMGDNADSSTSQLRALVNATISNQGAA